MQSKQWVEVLLSLAVLAERTIAAEIKERGRSLSMKLKTSKEKHMSYWQVIFSQSKVNGGLYNDTELPVINWNWPRDTYLQRRRSHQESLMACCPSHSLRDEEEARV